MKQTFDQVPANQFFDFSLQSSSADSAEITMPIKPEHLQEGNVVHGGIISALADTTAVYAFYSALPEDQTMIGIEFKINFVSPALLENGELKAAAHLVKKGQTIAICEVEVLQKEKLIAKGLFTYLIRPVL